MAVLIPFLIEGFGDRLLNEVKKVSLKDIKIKIYAPPERKYSTWIGGSILAGLSTFKKVVSLILLADPGLLTSSLSDVGLCRGVPRGSRHNSQEIWLLSGAVLGFLVNSHVAPHDTQVPQSTIDYHVIETMERYYDCISIRDQSVHDTIESWFPLEVSSQSPQNTCMLKYFNVVPYYSTNYSRNCNAGGQTAFYTE